MRSLFAILLPLLLAGASSVAALPQGFSGPPSALPTGTGRPRPTGAGGNKGSIAACEDVAAAAVSLYCPTGVFFNAAGARPTGSPGSSGRPRPRPSVTRPIEARSPQGTGTGSNSKRGANRDMKPFCMSTISAQAVPCFTAKPSGRYGGGNNPGATGTGRVPRPTATAKPSGKGGNNQ